MSDIMASIGLVQLRRANELYERRMNIVNFYDKSFKENPYLKTLRVKPGVQSSHHLYIILLELDRLTIDRAQFIAEMAQQNIECSVHFKPVHMMSYYAKKYGLEPQDFPNAVNAYGRIVSLPLSAKMTLNDAQNVVEVAVAIFKRFSR
jgi:dTDP-4-amino-4,6-dideoxygalactose transaminase